VDAFVQGGVLPPLIGEELSDQADDIIELLSGASYWFLPT
jgi:hypothetical protein